MFKSETTAQSTNNSTAVQTRMTIGFKPQRIETSAEVIPTTETIPQPNRYLECLLEAFTDFVKKEAQGVNPLCSMGIFKEKVEAAQILFKKERKELIHSSIIKSL